MKKSFTLLLIFFSISLAQGQIPMGYYDAATGLYGDTLRQVLHTIINTHTQITYASLWNSFQKTDKKTTGEVWDIYSDIPGGTPAYSFQFATNQCGNYAKEGDCYNREHTVPSSWFNDNYPMYSDIFHLYPTDGYVNGKRSNYPFGEVSSPVWTSTNGSKLGPNTFPGYAGTVFEPINDFKGDLARTYFYMIVCYMNVMPSWSSPMFSGDSLTMWSKSMLMKWHYQDTVSQKERNRNDSIYLIQGNRNPFIDHPEWVAAIWDNTGSGLADFFSQPSFSVKTFDNSLLVSNPAQEKLSITLHSAAGSLVTVVSSSDPEITIASSIPTGLYIFSVISQKSVLTRKIQVK
jgi:endonuclease I